MKNIGFFDKKYLRKSSVFFYTDNILKGKDKPQMAVFRIFYRTIATALFALVVCFTLSIAKGDTCGDGYFEYVNSDTNESICIEDKFQVKINITSADKKIFMFTMSAAGEFWIDWGDGTPVEYINRGTDASSYDTSYTEYYHDYSNTGEYTIHFGGEGKKYTTSSLGIGYNIWYYEANVPATVFLLGNPGIKWKEWLTEYNSKLNTPQAISMDTVKSEVNKFRTTGYVRGIYGSVGRLFPTIVNPDTGNIIQQPSFANTFALLGNAESTIPQELFDGVHGQPIGGMFYGTFATSKFNGQLPERLFGGLNGTYTGSLFAKTFYAVSGELILPTEDGFWGNIGGAPAGDMFNTTFSGATKLTGQLSDRFFGNFDGKPATTMFRLTFSGCSNLNSTLPRNLFQGIKGSPNPNNNENGAYQAFASTFNGCKKLHGSIPDGYGSGKSFFGEISGTPSKWMFSGVFAGCSGLSGSIPPHLFGKFWRDEANGVYSSGRYGAFDSAFQGCTGLTGDIPDDLFEGLGEISGTLFANMFNGCSGLTADLSQKHWFNGMYKNRYAESAYAGTFSGTGVYGKLYNGFFGTREPTTENGPQPSMFASTFSSTKIEGPIPDKLFGNLNGAPASNMFASTFANCSQLDGSIPSKLFYDADTGIGVHGNAAGNMFAGTFKNCSKLSGNIPSTLFAGVNGKTAGSMYSETFSGCSNLSGPLSNGMFGQFEQDSTAQSMYNNTFYGCSKLGTEKNESDEYVPTYGIPDNLFGIVSGPAQLNMYRQTFAGCSGLTGYIPENLFGDIYGTRQKNMFESTFSGANNIQGFQITREVNGDTETKEIHYIPSNFMKNVTLTVFEQESGGNYIGSGYYNCNSFPSVPGCSCETRNGVTTCSWSGFRSFASTFSGIPDSALATICPEDTYKYSDFWATREWSPKVSCNQCPTEYPFSISSADTNLNINQCFAKLQYVYGYDFNNDGVFNENDTVNQQFNYSEENKNGFFVNLPEPERTGFKPVEWYTDSEFNANSRVTNSTVFNQGNYVLYAKWVCDDAYYYDSDNDACLLKDDAWCIKQYNNKNYIWNAETLSCQQTILLLYTETNNNEIINLKLQPDRCIYDSEFQLPNPPDKPGYLFMGWKLMNM